MTAMSALRATTIRATIRDNRPATERPCGHPGRWCVHVIQALNDEPLRCDCGQPRCAHLDAARQAAKQ